MACGMRGDAPQPYHLQYEKEEKDVSKKRLLPVLLTLIIWAGMYYYYLPALNIHSNESWGFFVAMVAVALVINFWTLFKATFLSPADTDRATRLRRMKRIPAARPVRGISSGRAALLAHSARGGIPRTAYR